MKANERMFSLAFIPAGSAYGASIFSTLLGIKGEGHVADPFLMGP
jgi:hypothetical protein